jgi:hypothetical protein
MKDEDCEIPQWGYKLAQRLSKVETKVNGLLWLSGLSASALIAILLKLLFP